MMQRLIAVFIIVAIVLGGGYYAFKQLAPPPQAAALGPVYATKPVTRGDISVGVEVVGPLNPSRGGGIQVPGFQAVGMPATSYIISEILVQEGDVVQKGQTLARLAAPDLKAQIDKLQSDLVTERESLADLLNVSVAELDNIDPSRGITLQSPIDGRITGLTVKEGQNLKQGEIVARVVNDGIFRMTAKLLASEFANVKVGDKALLRFPQFTGTINAQVTDVNPNAITERVSDLNDSVSGGGGQDGNQFVFVYWVTLEGENPGLIQPGMAARVGLAGNAGKPLDEFNANWLRYYADVGGYAEEERVLSRADAIITRVFVRNMEAVKKGDPIISLAGDDAQNTIQEKLAKIRQIRLNIEQLVNQYSQLDVLSPMDGIVAYIEGAPGGAVQPGQWLGHIFTAEDMRLSAQVDDIDILLVQPGLAVSVTVDAVPGKTFSGEVMHVSTMGKDMDGITRFFIDIRVTGGSELRPGMQGKGFIMAGSAEGVLLVPLEAIFQEGDQSKVEVLNADGTVRLVPIKIGLMNNRHAEVKEGLTEGELVITGSTADLLPSQRIQSRDGILPERPDDGGQPADEQ